MDFKLSSNISKYKHIFQIQKPLRIIKRSNIMLLVICNLDILMLSFFFFFVNVFYRCTYSDINTIYLIVQSYISFTMKIPI